VHSDQAVTARLNAYPDWAIPAHVIAIIPTADRAKATVKVRVGFDARDDRILPEMGVRVAFLDTPSSASTETSSAGGAPRAFLVPADAVQASGDTGVVFVLNDDRAERRAVRLGGRVAGKQIVLSGLSAGALVATGDLSQLVDGAKVRVAN
jgi:multidrug efflux pump subunit AcrA (membrane-fusion protein)